jgi:hypothetical protein
VTLVVDRYAEREAFKRMLDFPDGRRVVVLKAEGDWGKSTLLQVFRDIAVWGNVEASLIELSQFEPKTPFDLVERLRKDLRQLAFPRFDWHNYLRTNKRRLPPPNTAPPSVILEQSPVGDQATVAAYIEQVIQGDVGTLYVQVPDWTDEQELYARERSVDEFLKDLAVLKTPLVVLLDAYERLGPLAGWVERELLRRSALHPNDAAHVVVVLAGRRVPDFRAYLDERVEEMVLELELKPLARQDIIELFPDWFDPEEDEISFLCTQHARGAPVGALVQMAQVIAGSRRRGGS